MKYEREYFIHYYDCENSLRLNIISLLKYFEDIALLHCEHVNVGLDYYNKNNVAWLLYKWDITIYRLPKFKDKIKIITEPLGYARFYAYRLFEVRDENNELLIQGNSLWFLIDTNLRKPKKITEEHYSSYNVSPDDRKQLNIEEVQALNNVDFQKEYFVRKSDIDTNDHVNNTKYVEWALEVVPEYIVKDYILKRLKVNYKKETNYGKKIKTLVEVLNENEMIICRHRIEDGDEGICFLETYWQKVSIK